MLITYLSKRKRHIIKTISWRLIGTFDTFLLSYLLTSRIDQSLSIASVEIFTKIILYYFHERVWFKYGSISAMKRHISKTFSWRIISTSDTIIISFVITNNIYFGLSIGIIEVFTKMILYFFHERLWYKSNFGLNEYRK